MRIVSKSNKFLTKTEFHNFDYKDSVVAATTASFTMASTATTNTLVLANGEGGFDSSANTFTQDSISLTQNQRVLIQDGINSNGTGVHGKWNGIYTVGDLTATSLTLTRAVDFGTSTEIHSGCQFHVEKGGTHADTNFVVTTDGTITVGTTAITFTNISSTAAVATTVTVTDNEDTAEDNLITFVAGAATSTGNHGLEMDGHLTYNPNTGTVAAPLFSGSGASLTALNGTNISSGTVAAARMHASQTAITSIYNTALKVGRDASGDWIDFGTDDNIKVHLNNVEEFRFASGGAFHADADITSFSTTVASDKRLKTNIKKLEYGLQDVLQLRGVEFDWKEKRNGKHDIGFIAQEVQEIIPEVINEIPDLQDETNKYLGVDYSKIVPLLVESIKEQQKQIEDLRNEVELLKINM